jgi:hypothetical protein
MGGSAISLEFSPSPGARLAGADAIEEVLLELLDSGWRERLDAPWKDTATDWISLGEDSLLTLEVWGDPPSQVLFWFHDVVEWPLALARHWLVLVLVGNHFWVDRALQRLGYRLDLSKFPRVDPSDLYFQDGDLIGRASQQEIEWVTGGRTPHDELSEQARAEVDRVLDTERCRCPICRWSRLGVPERDEAVPGWSVTLVDWREDEGKTRIVPDGEEPVLVCSSSDWGLHAWMRGKRRLDPPLPGGWLWLALDRRDQTWVALTRTGQTLVSSDAERWRELEDAALPAQARVVGGRDAVVWLATEEALYRSTDAGRTFTRYEPPSVSPCRSVEGAAELIAVVCVGELWVSEDGGASWAQREIPLWLKQLVVDGSSAIVVFGEELPVQAAFSRDAGRSWQDWSGQFGESHKAAACGPQGRWWWSVMHTGEGELAFFSAPALGAPWEPCAKTIADGLFPDPSDPDLVWAAYGGVVLRVCRQV